GLASVLATGLTKAGVKIANESWFDCVKIAGTKDQIAKWHAAANGARMNFRHADDVSLAINLDETTSAEDLRKIFSVFGVADTVESIAAATTPEIPKALQRTSAILEHPVFNRHRSETEMMRYIKSLESRDLSLT